MGTVFSEELVRLRKGAGFRTAYAFYHGNGGEPVLKVSYRKYLLMEQGKLLPVFERLNQLLYALRLVHNSAEARGLVTSWLKTMAGGKSYDGLIAPMLAKEPQVIGISPMHKAAKKALDSRKYYVSLAQLKAIVSSREAYLCYTALSNDTGAWKLKDLAEVLRLEPKAAAAALAVLGKAKVVKESKGSFRCPFAGMMTEFPHLATVPAEMHRKCDEMDDWLLKSGKPVWLRSGVIRADEDSFREFFPVMGLNISTAQTYAVTEKSPKSALFMVEGRISKLRDF